MEGVARWHDALGEVWPVLWAHLDHARSSTDVPGWDPRSLKLVCKSFRDWCRTACEPELQVVRLVGPRGKTLRPEPGGQAPEVMAMAASLRAVLERRGRKATRFVIDLACPSQRSWGDVIDLESTTLLMKAVLGACADHMQDLELGVKWDAIVDALPRILPPSPPLVHLGLVFLDLDEYDHPRDAFDEEDETSDEEWEREEEGEEEEEEEEEGKHAGLLRALPGLQALQSLRLRDARLRLTLQGLLRVLPPSLTSLELDQTWFGGTSQRFWSPDTTAWSRLTALRRLAVRNVYVETYPSTACPSCLSLLTALTQLSFEGSAISYQPGSLQGLERLQHLDVGYCFGLAPASITHLTGLTALRIFLPKAEAGWPQQGRRQLDLARFPRLQHLALANFGLAKVPPVLCALGLTHLDLSWSDELDLIAGGHLSGLTALQELVLARRAAARLRPGALRALCSLTRLAVGSRNNAEFTGPERLLELRGGAGEG